MTRTDWTADDERPERHEDTMKKDTLYVLGLDVSPTQGAAVRIPVYLGDIDPIGSITTPMAWAITGRAGIAKKSRRGTGVAAMFRSVPSNPKANPLQIRLARIDVWRQLLQGTKVPEGPLAHYDLASLEGYAYNADNRAHTTGEGGGIVRYALHNRGIPIREYQPTSSKLFWAGKGNATKEEVIRQIERRYPDVVAEYRQFDTSNYHETFFGLCEAFGYAVIGATELLLRRGQIHVRDLREEGRVRVFNRVAKPYSTNLLDAPLCEGRAR